MRRTCINLALLAAVGSLPASLRAQEAGWSRATTPSVGFGYVLEDGSLESGSLSFLAEFDWESTAYRLGAFGAVRAGAASCADGIGGSCRDLTGESLGVSGSRLVGDLGFGVGIGLVHREFSGWRVQPHAALSVSPGVLRVQLRVEFPEGTDDIHLPLLMGIRIPL